MAALLPTTGVRRLSCALALGLAVVAGTAMLPTSAEPGGDRHPGDFAQQYDAARVAAGQRPVSTPIGAPLSTPTGAHVDPPGTPPHDHNDPATKNSVSRAALPVPAGALPIGATAGAASTKDPTTSLERTAARRYVETERLRPDPRLVTVNPYPRHTTAPRDRYALANGCYALAGEPIFFKPTRLGTYLLYDRARRFVTAGGARASAPSPAAEWTATLSRGRMAFTNAGQRLALEGTSAFALSPTTGCTAYPEVSVDVRGAPHAGTTSFQEVRGYVDAHTHHMAFDFLGGTAHCGRPWHPYGVAYALEDCPDHTYTGGTGGVLESLMSGEPRHDPVGWPTFKDWPAPESLTHEGTYYVWMERAWRGGQRMLVNLLVENNQLCQLYPMNVANPRHNSCDDMDSIRLQAKDAYAFENYVDAQFGGPGRGFYRIVTTPWQARQVINAGKMAVVLGIETSVPFGCSVKRGRPTCTAEQIDRQLDEVRRLGISQMELTNKFDNALTGVAGDEGAIGPLVNGANFLETGTFWDMRHCTPAVAGAHDKRQYAVPDISAGQQDALFGAVAQVSGVLGTALPLYGPPEHCNNRGLTALGEHAIKALAARHMLFDPDHMSVKGRQAAMTLVERMRYAGVLSSHSWSTPDAYPRIYRAGGFIAPYAGDSTGFVQKWRTHQGWADSRFFWGIGFGADINGLGAQGNPRGPGASNPVTYPFRGLNGITISRERGGERTWDINTDGVAHYGLYPDWIEDLRRIAESQHAGDGAAIVDDLARGTEAYLQTWERAYGVRPDACRDSRLRRTTTALRTGLTRGLTTQQVLLKAGQPYTRLGTTYRYCARTSSRANVPVDAVFTRSGRLSAVRVR